MRIRELRKARKLTQIQLAAELGWDQGSISRVERGEQNITLAKLKELADHFDVTVPDLFVYEGKNELVKAAFSIPASDVPRVLRVLQIFEQEARAH